MAMNKTERAEMERLQGREAVLRSIGYPQFPRPEPMPESDQLQQGWIFNGYAACKDGRVAVGKMWRKALISYNREPQPNDHLIGSRSPIDLYATEAEAYRALAYELADHLGSLMAKVYAKCF